MNRLSKNLIMEGDKAVILGATSVIAISVCRLLARRGQSLILVARNEERLKSVCKDMIARGAHVQSVVADLADVSSHEQLMDKIEDGHSFWFFYGELPEQKIVETDWNLVQQSINVNFTSVVSLLTRIATLLETRGRGSIVVTSSVAGDRGRGSNYVYGASKGGLSLFCSGLRNRLHPQGISVLTVKPGFVDTAMTASIDKKPAFLWASADRVALDIIKAHDRGVDVKYSPWFWRYILLIIRLVPEKIFKRLSL